MKYDILIKINSIILIIMTLILELALVIGVFWSLATGQSIILSLSLMMLSGAFGIYIYDDYEKFIIKQ